MSYPYPYLSSLDYRRTRAATPSDGSLTLPLTLAALLVAVIAGSLITHGPGLALALLLVFVVGVLYGAMTNINTAICWYVAYAAVEGMYKYMTNFSQAIYVLKPLLAVVILIGWGLNHHKNAARMKTIPLAALIGMFVTWGFLEAFNPLGYGMTAGIITFLVWYGVPLVFYIVGYHTLASTRQMLNLLYVIVAVCTVVAAYCFLQYALGREWTLSHVPGYSNLKLAQWIGEDSNGKQVISFRPASTTTAEGFASLWCNLGAVSALGLALLPGVPVQRKVCLFACLLVNVGGLIVSGVRLFVIISIIEAFLLFVLTSVSPTIMLRNLVLAASVGLVSLVGFNAAQSISGGAIASRYAETLANPYAKFSDERGGGFVGQTVWLTGFLTDHPFGVGYQRGIGGAESADADESKKLIINRETEFAAISDDMGIPGLLIFWAIIVMMLTSGWAVFRRLKTPRLKISAAVLFVSLIGYTIGYWGGQMLIAIGDYIYLFAGILFALPALERREIALSAAKPAPGKAQTS